MSERLLTMDDLLDDAGEQRTRTAGLQGYADARYNRRFAQAMSGTPFPSPTEVLADAAADGAVDQVEVNHVRCHAELDRALQNGLGFAELRGLLGTDRQAVRASMLDSQDRMRARFAEVERRKGELERELDRLRREVVSLRGGQDRAFEVMASHGYGASTSYR